MLVILSKRVAFIACLLLLQLSTAAQPDKVWATYFGDKGNDWVLVEVSNVLHSPDGSLYVAGVNWDSTVHLTTPGSFLPDFGVNSLANAYVARFDAGGQLLWCSYIHNGEMTVGSLFPKIALDQDGQLLVSGHLSNSNAGVYVNNLGSPGTYSPEVPLYAREAGGSSDYLIKFDSLGQKVWGTYLETGSSTDTALFWPTKICTDAANNIIVGGYSDPTHFSFPPGAYMPAANSHDPAAFLMKFNASGQLSWGSFYGDGSGVVLPSAIASNAAGDIYMAGLTNIAGTDTAIATPDAFYPESVVANGALLEGFLTKFSADGQRIWGTYSNGMGGTCGMVVDNNDNVYLLSTSNRDTGIATPGAHQQVLGGTADMVLSKWDAHGNKTWATYYGGAGQETNSFANIGPIGAPNSSERNSLSMDDQGNLLIVGSTLSTDGIQVGCTYTPAPNAPGDGFIARFYPDGHIMWGSYYDMPLHSVSCGTGSNFYIVSATNVDGLATPGAHQATKTPGTYAGFLSLMSKNFNCPPCNESLSLEDNVLSIATGYFDYQWYQDGVPIEDATGNTYAATDSGLYYVSFKDSCNCSYTSDTLAYPPGTGIYQENNQYINVQAYPNPAHSSLHITGTVKGSYKEISLTIFDITGRKTMERQVPLNNGQLDAILDINQLAPGMYQLKISTASQSRYIKFVKQQ